MGPSAERAVTIYSNDSARLNKMATMPIHGKPLKKLLLQNQESFDVESWQITSGQGLLSLFK